MFELEGQVGRVPKRFPQTRSTNFPFFLNFKYSVTVDVSCTASCFFHRTLLFSYLHNSLSDKFSKYFYSFELNSTRRTNYKL